MSSPKLRWSKPKPPNPPERPSKLSFNSLFGLRSKKPLSTDSSSAVVLQDPDVAPFRTGRPPSKSISSTRSFVDSFGPKTPTDGLGESRRSLLTLSDHDPFAGRGITVVSSPQSTTGSNRLSIHSNTSLPEVFGGKLEGRALFSSPALSSPRDRPLSPDSALSIGYPAFSQPDSPRARKSTLKVSSADLTRKGPTVTLDALFSSATNEPQTKSGPFPMLAEKGHPPTPTRPMRARGLTESAMINHSSPILSSRSLGQTPDVPSTPSRSPLRQMSVSRLGSPLSSPPIHDLPPPPASTVPLSVDASSGDDSVVLTDPTSSSTLSFSSVSLDHLSYSPRRKAPTRKPKKAVSHSSLAKLSASISSIESSGSQAEGEQGERSLRKQRSFHHPKPPTLPNIYSPTSTLPMPSSPSGSQSPVTEQGRCSVSSLAGRRRLFSAARRPSTSQSISVEDDTRSVLSLRSEQNPPLSPSRPWMRSSSCSPSFGDDGTSDDINSPQYASKYTPQHIMSPAEMDEVAASVEIAASPRSRGLSISTITSFKDQENELSTPATSPPLSPFSNSSKSSTFPSRSSSLLYKNSVSPPQRILTHPSTSQASITLTTNEQSAYQPSSSPPLSLMSLPPPPRPRQRTTTGPSSSKTPTDTQHHHDPGFRTFLQPIPRKSLLPKTSVEKFLRRHSLLRKPSFLEIDDDVAQDTHDKSKPAKSPGDSFLDLTRESFDVCIEEP